MTEVSPPLMSVIVPSFGMARFLPEMLDSTLAQDYRPLEIIVVDGGSTDGTVDILQDYTQRQREIRWISEPDEGPSDAVNKGLALANGSYAAIQNADDIYRPGAITAAIAKLQEHPEASLVYGDVDNIDLAGHTFRTRYFPPFSWAAFFANSCTLAQSSVVFRMDAARQIGGWDGRYYSCDLDFWLRLCFQGTPIHLPQVLSAWRRYPEQRTRKDQFGRIWHDYWRMIDESAELKSAPWRLRRLARASCHLLAMRYHPSGNRWAVRMHTLSGLLLHPTAWRYQPGVRVARALVGETMTRRVRRLFRSPARP